MRLGGFHTQCYLILVIMMFCEDGGLRDILIDSDIYASASVDQMFSGKQYKRAVRGLTLVYEAMIRCLMTSFFKWCEQKAHTICRELWNQLLDVQIYV